MAQIQDELNAIVEQLLAKYDTNVIKDVITALTNKITKETGEKIEPILDPANQKFTAFPIKYQEIWKKYKIQMACFWKAEEIDFSGDYEDYLTLNENEKHFVEMILAFFAASDGIVNFNLSERFIKEIQTTEIIFTYQYQTMMENVHCVADDTLILTDNGYFEIEELLDDTVNVWNGKEFTETTVKYTGDSELYCVTLSNGMFLECTPEHRWFINDDVVFTKDLKINDRIKHYELPIMDMVNNDDQNVTINSPKERKVKWLQDLCNNNRFVKYNYDSDGTSIIISNISELTMINTQLMFTMLGVNMTHDGENLYISKHNTSKLFEMGFSPKLLKFKSDNKISNNDKPLTIAKIELLDGIHKTYCFSEPKEHAGVFNGILTGQSEVYSLMLDNIVKDEVKKDHLFRAIDTVQTIKDMSNWALKWIESDKSFGHRVVAFVLVEGLFFQGPFAALFWLKKYKNKERLTTKSKPFMCGLMDSNKFIARDEGQHTLFGCDVYNLLENKLSQSEITEIFNDAILLSKNFMLDAVPVQLIGMNYDKMTQYLEYVADRLLVLLGYNKMFNATNPFKFMETIGLNDKTNFFEKRPTEYQDSHIMNKGNKSDIIIKDDDF